MRADCHMHMVLDGVDWRAAIAAHREKPDDALIHRRLARYRDLGFTYLRDGGDRWSVGKRARELARDYGITYRTPLAPLCMAGHYGAFIGEKYQNLREYGTLVQKAREEKADFIKVMISGLMDFDHFGVLTEPGLEEDEISHLIRIAHEEGFRVMAHCNGPRTAQAAAAAGVDSVEHGAYLDRRALEEMARRGVIWVPTLSTIGNLLGKGRFDDDQVRQILDSALENVRIYASLGGLLAPGSDAGAWAVPHGSLSEYAWMEEALGPKNREILDRGIQAICHTFR